VENSIGKKTWLNRILYVIITSLFIIVIDQGLKRIALKYGDIEIEKNITLKINGAEHEVVNVSMLIDLNNGISFSLLSNFIERTGRLVLPILATFILIIFVIPTITNLELAAKGMVIGGAISNIIDRIYFSGVIDFISIRLFDASLNLIINFADLFIFFGLVIISISIFFRRLKK
jgi:signal peptidase II